MAVDDHGLEVLKKSGEEVVAGSKANYYIKVGLFGGSLAPVNTDAIVATYPSSTVEVYTFKQGGVSGTTLKTVTVTYTTSSKKLISTVVYT